MDAKKKRAIVEEVAKYNAEEYGDYETILKFQVHRAEGIDQPRPLNSFSSRYYRVYAWISPGEEDQAYSGLTLGRPNPSWDMVDCLPLGDFDPDGKFLHLEVVKVELGSKDPGPSNREVLVGRTRIRLPDKLSVKKSGSFELVRLHEGETTKPAGYIVVSMLLKRIRLHSRQLRIADIEEISALTLA